MANAECGCLQFTVWTKLEKCTYRDMYAKPRKRWFLSSRFSAPAPYDLWLESFNHSRLLSPIHLSLSVLGSDSFFLPSPLTLRYGTVPGILPSSILVFFLGGSYLQTVLDGKDQRQETRITYSYTRQIMCDPVCLLIFIARCDRC